MFLVSMWEHLYQRFALKKKIPTKGFMRATLLPCFFLLFVFKAVLVLVDNYPATVNIALPLH